MKPIKFVKLMGKLWGLKYVYFSDKETDGTCDPPDQKKKAIRIRKSIKGKDELETYIHEGQHACNDSLAEEYIQQSSADLANMLWRLGYRRIQEES